MERSIPRRLAEVEAGPPCAAERGRWASALALGILALSPWIGTASAADPAQEAIQRELLQRQWQQRELRQRLQEGTTGAQEQAVGSAGTLRRRLELQQLRQSQERALVAPSPPSESEAAQEARRALRERSFREERQRLEGQPRPAQDAPENPSGTRTR